MASIDVQHVGCSREEHHLVMWSCIWHSFYLHLRTQKVKIHVLQQSCYTIKLHMPIHEQINFTLKKNIFLSYSQKRKRNSKKSQKLNFKKKNSQRPKTSNSKKIDLLQLVMHYKDKNITNFMTKKVPQKLRIV
jgi:hypothetical protein